MLNLAHIKGPSDISEKDIDDESRALGLKIGDDKPPTILGLYLTIFALPRSA